MMYTIFQKPVRSRGYDTTVLAVLVAIFTLLSATGGVSAQAICNITNYDETLDDGWAVSALSGNPSSITWNNKTIRVESGATVHFDRNVTMNQCTVRMDLGAKIIVEGGATLTTTGTSKRLLDTGVFAKDGSSLYIQNVAFEDVRNMISSIFGRALTVRNCSLINGTGSGIGMTETNTYKPVVIINDNNLKFSNVPTYAIKVDRSPASSALSTTQNQIDNNIIEVSGAHTFSSKLINIRVLNGGTDNFPITRNKITITATLSTTGQTPTCHGIYIEGLGMSGTSGGFRVTSNKLYYNSTNKPTNASPNLGISLINVNGYGSFVDGNEVYATLFSSPVTEEGASWMKCAFHLDNAPHLTVCDNTGDKTYRLFHFSGALDYCDFAKNTINEHYYGIICAKNNGSTAAMMGQQRWHENTWLTTASSYEKRSAYNSDFPNGGVPFQFRVHSNVPAENPPGASLNPPKVSPANWFVSINPGQGESENSICIDGNLTSVPSDGLAGWDGDVIAGTFTAASASQAWDVERDLLYKLLQRPAFRPTGSAAKTWYDNRTTSSTWKYANFADLYAQAYQYTTAAQASLDSVQAQYNTLIQTIIYLDSLQNVDITTDDYTTRQSQLSAADQLNTVRTNLENKQTQANTAVQTALSTAQTAWNNLPTTYTWESNWKTFYGFLLQQAQGTAFTDANYATMRSIANLCPLEAGMSVRNFPLLLPTEEANYYSKEDYWADCVDSVKTRQGIQMMKPIANTLTVFPNPANQQLTLFLKQATEAAWVITDLTGRTWKKGQVPADQNSVTFYTQDLPSGLYLCTVQTQFGLTLTAKIAIQH